MATQRNLTLRSDRLQGLRDYLRRNGIVVKMSLIPRRRHLDQWRISFSQERLWFLDQLESGNAVYNMPTVFRVSRELNFSALEWSLTEIVRRHETLRTTFACSENGAAHRFAAAMPVTVPIVDLSELAAEERKGEVRRCDREEARRPFDLTRGPLFRVVLLQIGEQDHVLIVVMHHILSDGCLLGIFRRELRAFYLTSSEGKPSPLADLPVQYADYAVWQGEWLKGEILERELSYWKEQLKGAPPVLELPIDHPRPAVQSYRGATERLRLSAQLTQ